MIVKTLDEGTLREIGAAFANYDYGDEKGLASLFSSRAATAEYIYGCARGMLRGGFLHATSERGEGFIAYKLPGEKLGFRAVWPIAQSSFRAMRLREIIHFLALSKQGGEDLRTKMDKAKKPYIFVGLVCVREQYQGQGYMRKVMDIAFAEGDRLHVPVILDTDAKLKCEKYIHLGMQDDVPDLKQAAPDQKLIAALQLPN